MRQSTKALLAVFRLDTGHGAANELLCGCGYRSATGSKSRLHGLKLALIHYRGVYIVCKVEIPVRLCAALYKRRDRIEQYWSFQEERAWATKQVLQAMQLTSGCLCTGWLGTAASIIDRGARIGRKMEALSMTRFNGNTVGMLHHELRDSPQEHRLLKVANWCKRIYDMLQLFVYLVPIPVPAKALNTAGMRHRLDCRRSYLKTAQLIQTASEGQTFSSVLLLHSMSRIEAPQHILCCPMGPRVNVCKRKWCDRQSA